MSRQRGRRCGWYSQEVQRTMTVGGGGCRHPGTTLSPSPSRRDSPMGCPCASGTLPCAYPGSQFPGSSHIYLCNAAACRCAQTPFIGQFASRILRVGTRACARACVCGSRLMDHRPAVRSSQGVALRPPAHCHLRVVETRAGSGSRRRVRARVPATASLFFVLEDGRPPGCVRSIGQRRADCENEVGMESRRGESIHRVHSPPFRCMEGAAAPGRRPTRILSTESARAGDGAVRCAFRASVVAVRRLGSMEA